MTNAKEAHLGIAQSLIALGRPQEALEALQAGEIQSGGRGGMLRATALAELGQFKEARELVDLLFTGDSTRSQPGSPEALHDRERVHARVRLAVGIENTPDVESELRGLLAARPEDAFVQSSLGFALTMQGKPELTEEGLALLRSAARKNPEDADIQANLGWGAFRAGVREEAKRHLQRALEIDPRRSLDRARFAMALAGLGEIDAARIEAGQALKQDPGAAWADEIREIARAQTEPEPTRPSPVSAQ